MAHLALRTQQHVPQNRSDVFAKMFDLPLQEAVTGVVEIQDATTEAMTLFLEFMYTSTFQDEELAEVSVRLDDGFEYSRTPKAE